MATSRVLLIAAALALVCLVGVADAGKMCPRGYKNCDTKKWDCETCVARDVNNCGDCGKKCKTVSYAVTKCFYGSCKYTCKPKYANCDKKWDNGCEVNTDNDAKNCGKCGNCCKQVKNADTKCKDGKCCEPVCKAKYANCDKKWGNGCEVNTDNDAKNCGKCGNCCKQVKNADTMCKDGKCCEPVCKKGYGNCDGNIWKNGCEQDLTKDVHNCGKCGNKCPCTLKGGEPTCSKGKCGEQCKKGSKYDSKKKCCVPSLD